MLDVGCGAAKIAGSIGVDIISLDGVDVVCNLNKVPWPFGDNTFSRVVAKHSLAHLDDIVSVMEEIHRVSRDGATIEILCPHYASDNYNTDPTHKTHFGFRSMYYFCDNVQFKYRYYSDARFRLERASLSFREVPVWFREHLKWNPFRMLGMEWLVNRFPRFYERFLVYLLPPSEVYYRLKVIKGAGANDP